MSRAKLCALESKSRDVLTFRGDFIFPAENQLSLLLRIQLPAATKGGALRNIAIVLGNHSTPFRRGMIIDEVAARNMIKNESVALQESNNCARFNGGKFRHIQGRAKLPAIRRPLE